ncbi:MAG: hypothetical protein IPN67_06165 [Bacteroidales bacterium]|nr:hypothetical protein [Bacteroidales bacterium]
MKISRPLLLSILLLFMTTNAGNCQTPDSWHYPMYLANMGYWHSRIPVHVINSSTHDISGEPLTLVIGEAEGELHLTGENASGVRVIDSGGTELLWRITSHEGGLVTDTTIPWKSRLILPVTIKRGQSAIYYIYFNNIAAWPVGAVLEEERYGRKENIQAGHPNNDSLNISIKATQTISLSQNGISEAWPADQKWDIRVPVKVFIFGGSRSEDLPVYVRMEQVYLRLHTKDVQNAAMKMGSKGDKSCFRFEKAVLFPGQMAAESEQTRFLYFDREEKEDKARMEKAFIGWQNNKRNLLRTLTSTGVIKSTGWTQDILIKPGKSYIFGVMAGASDTTNTISMIIGFQGKGDTTQTVYSTIERSTITSDWKFISTVFRSPEESSSVRVSLKLSEPGSARYNGMLMMEVIEGYSGSMFFEQREAGKPGELAVWPVNPVVKVFHEDLPPMNIQPLGISVAKNETEPLQIALRSPVESRNMRIEVTQPMNSGGQKLDRVSLNIVGYVPIDYPSNYYEKKVPYWHLKYPTEPIGSDGFSGYWPDPLLPAKPFDLKANTTQPIWIEVNVPDGTLPGDYSGKIKIYSEETLIKELPWTVHVWNFTLPVRNSFGLFMITDLFTGCRKHTSWWIMTSQERICAIFICLLWPGIISVQER